MIALGIVGIQIILMIACMAFGIFVHETFPHHE